MSDVSRREALGLLAAIPVAAGLGAAPAAAERTFDAARAVVGGVMGGVPNATRFFTPHELRTVHVLADLIIPRDGRSGSASDAGVPAFIDFTVDDRPSLRVPVRGGLAWLDAESRKRFERPFVELADAQRTAILDDIAWPAKAPPELSQGVAFFTLFRDLVASGFYSSREGMRDLDYRGNAVVLHWDGCPPSACAHLGVAAGPGAARSDAGGRAMRNGKLGVGFVGSGFNARFHMRGWVGVREADVLGVWSPNQANAASAAELANALDVGAARPYASIAEMVADPDIDAVWLTGPNHARVENVEEIVHAIESGRGELKGLACEKPLARNVAEARRVLELVRRVGLTTGYLENQLFAPQIEYGRALLWARGAATTGRPYLARAAEEHSGPHMPWFWQGALQGGGVLNDMMCHSALVVRHLLTAPGEPYASVRPVRVTGHIASLKWTRPPYRESLARRMGADVDYARAPAEDFASLHVEFETADGTPAIGEATTSWSFVGAGLRLSAELLGPEYSMKWDSLESGLDLFFSREVRGAAGEDLVEKQNAESGLMPVVADEAVAYGYQAEDRHFARAFLGRETPRLTFEDGLDVVTLLMTAYRSAEEGRTLDFPPEGIERFVPAVARGEWNPRR